MAEDLETLFPDADLILNGEPVTVREYRFLDGLKVAAMAQSLMAGLADLFLEETAPEAFDFAALEAVFGSMPGLLVELLSISTGKPQAWIETLSDDDGHTLMMTWWRVNSGFFVRRLAAPLVARQRANAQAGVASSPN